MVLVITIDSILAKRFRTFRENDIMIFENDSHEDDQVLKFSKKDIKEILMIRGKICNVLVPHHQVASKGKLQNMEESIEFLKKRVIFY